MTKVVVIKFKNGGKLYYFSPRQGEVYERNMPVVVETARGLEFAWVAYSEREVEDKEVVQPLKPIIRIATQRDKEFYAACEAKKPSFMWKRTALNGSAYSGWREEERTLKICSTAVMLILSRISSISTGEMVFRSLSELISTASKGAR